ncbi:hypothetical protein [Nocardia sp. NPDC056000]|uniref:hypothetical protein n=1 Tax=Nocardia sp. NPDC056000 TaxID=3345674 RepID=UPI0035DD042D
MRKTIEISVRTLAVVAVAVLAALVGIVIIFINWRAPEPARVENPAPNHLVLFDSVIGETLPRAEDSLGLSNGKVMRPVGQPRVVPLRDGDNLDGVPKEQLVVLGICVPDFNANPLTIYFGVAPRSSVSQEDIDLARVHAPVPNPLEKTTGCRNDMSGWPVSDS